MFKNIIAASTMLLTAGCVSSTQTPATSFTDTEQATVLMTVGEGWLINSGQAYVVLSGHEQSTTLRSMTSRSGGSGNADRVDDGRRAYEYNAVNVKPGEYAITDWGFSMRAGDATNRQSSAINLEAGKVYYIGALYANNLTQTAKISDTWSADRAAYLSKFPSLASASVQNLASRTAINCWKMNVTDNIAAGNPTLIRAVRNCR